MASGKVKTAKAQKAKISFIKALVIAVIILCVVGFFVYISGILPKLMTGMKVVETAADGTQTTVANISVLETNYHFNEVFSMYAMYGMVSKDTLDDTVDETEGQTYREFIYQTAGDELMNSALVRRAADAAGYSAHSGAARYADMQLEAIRSSATTYGYKSLNQYLQAMYGTGFNANDYKTFSQNEAYTNEYENYLKQFEFVPSTEDIQSTFDEDPTEFERADFNYYLFSANKDDDGNVTDLDKTKSDAQAVVNAVNRGKTFKEAVKTVLERDVEANADKLVSFSDDNVDPTVMTGYSHSTAEYQFKEEVADAIFGEVEIGKAFTVELEDGTYVICVTSKTIDETPTVAYRTLTLANTASSESEATAEQIAAGLAEVRATAESLVQTRRTPIEFSDVVKQNTTNQNEILSGGYASGAVATDFQSGDAEGNADQTNADLGAWLFDEARTEGDTYIVSAADSSNVTIYYFEASYPAWMNSVRDKYITARVNGWSQELTANSPSYQLNYQLLKLLQY